MQSGEFAAAIFPGITPDAELKEAGNIVRDRKDAMTFRIFDGQVETLNGQAKQALASVKDTPERHQAFVLALIHASESIGRKVVMRIREDGGRVQISPVYPEKK